jgi:plastocyanin
MHPRTVAVLALAAGALVACGDDDTPAAEAAPPAGDAPAAVTVDIADFAFDPQEIEVAAGTTVVFANADGFAHTAEAEDGSFDTGDIEGGASSSAVAFEEPGTYPYFCGIHNYMTGTVTVTG